MHLILNFFIRTNHNSRTRKVCGSPKRTKTFLFYNIGTTLIWCFDYLDCWSRTKIVFRKQTNCQLDRSQLRVNLNRRLDASFSSMKNLSTSWSIHHRIKNMYRGKIVFLIISPRTIVGSVYGKSLETGSSLDYKETMGDCNKLLTNDSLGWPTYQDMLFIEVCVNWRIINWTEWSFYQK